MFDQMEFEAVLSCGMCSQPYAVSAARLAVAKGINLPRHGMLGPSGEPPSGVGRCAGSGLPPMRHRSRAEFEAWWREHHGEAPSPEILGGSEVWLGEQP